MTAREHNRLVGIFLMAHGGLQAAMMLLISFIYLIIGGAVFLGGRDGAEFAGAIVVFAVLLIVAISLVFVVPQIVGGYKLWKEKPNARTWGIVGSIMSCLSFPLGTAAGVYGMWFLFGPEGKQMYLNGSVRPMFPNRSPEAPPPHSWQ